MTRKIFITIFALIMAASLFSSCSKQNESTDTTQSPAESSASLSDKEQAKALIGAWKADIDGIEYIYSFHSDGTAMVYLPNMAQEGNYVTYGNYIDIVQTVDSDIITFTYAVNGDELSLTRREETIVFKKTTKLPQKNKLSDTQSDELKGVWEHESKDFRFSFTFNGDGNGVMYRNGLYTRMTYTIGDGYFEYSVYSASGSSNSSSTKYTLIDNLLTLEDGTVLTKKQ